MVLQYCQEKFSFEDKLFVSKEGRKRKIEFDDKNFIKLKHNTVGDKNRQKENDDFIATDASKKQIQVWDVRIYVYRLALQQWPCLVIIPLP